MNQEFGLNPGMNVKTEKFTIYLPNHFGEHLYDHAELVFAQRCYY